MSIKIEGLQKSYRSFQALKNIDLQIGTGLFGLLGPNGAGKTTLMKILSTILPFQEGEVSIYGHDLVIEGDKVRELLGYLPQHFNVPTQFTGKEFLHYVASMKGVTNQQERNSQVEKLLEEVNLTAQANKKIKGYSGGMKRRLGIAQALIGNPKLIILDEPTAGLDPSERIRFRNLIEKLSKDHSIILSTHIISDIESSCENVAVINHGDVLFQGSTEELAEIATNVVWELTVPFSEYDQVEKEYVIISSRKEKDQVVFRIISNEKPQGEVSPIQPTIEDGYMAVINGVTS
ncbi:ABC transporter ATP-binding protein [Lederbergia wuyishanensis]|uniref:ABC-type multidrug transport system ATPase subunit n=1 Tax=Lederbergia wuyishanensis TaxID=1347903 RepID=A0ABU0D3Z8_9BACI|nr:ABC transporter ATP-binding protein [Lederbergia wuyishanensis]MCJ8008276.1 ABC transporter ATP-binding protein [Lederbergia wuyishanensis]MDQ0343133.1 ABC-type multidrug transport system ATPase subunit [Lederbergia wuyishanensis]